MGGAFQPFTAGQEVTLTQAPQGGSGVQTVMRTRGLIAGEGATVNADLDVEISGQNAGHFRLEGAPLVCTEGVGGQIFGQVVGLDPDTYATTDDLLQLDGMEVTLVVTLTDEDGNQAIVRQPVTLRVGG